mmetsp:Transcript_48804/g.56251  ORF Transcript_48804/g.56251 Transcript_48804/m.56251 type:complete len:237 (+) Transcript_48804:35-745(+)
MSTSALQLNSNDSIDEVGICPVDGRPYECFSINAQKLICPSCLMFGKNKGDEVISIPEAAKLIRDELDKSIKAGIFKADRCDSTLLDIRQTKLQCDEAKYKVVKEVENAFSQLIKTLKDRKNSLLKEIDELFAQQFESIKEQEERWIKKQEISAGILKNGQGSDMALVKRSQEILSGLNNLWEPMNYHLTQILNSVDLHFRIQGKDKQLDLNLEELISAFSNYGKKGEVHNIQYRC